MAYKLAIENTVKVPVKFDLSSNGKAVPFAFSLNCDRLSQEEIKARLDDAGVSVSAVLREVTKGWSDQTLVLGEDGKPADFSKDAFEIMLGIAGVSTVLFKAYIKEVGAKEKN